MSGLTEEGKKLIEKRDKDGVDIYTMTKEQAKNALDDLGIDYSRITRADFISSFRRRFLAKEINYFSIQLDALIRCEIEQYEKQKTMIIAANTNDVPATHIPSGNYYTIEQLAQLYGVTRRTAQQWIDKGWIKSIYFGGAHHIEAGQLENFTRPKPGPHKKTN